MLSQARLPLSSDMLLALRHAVSFLLGALRHVAASSLSGTQKLCSSCASLGQRVQVQRPCGRAPHSEVQAPKQRHWLPSASTMVAMAVEVSRRHC